MLMGNKTGVHIMMGNVNLEGWNFGSCFLAYRSTRHWLGLSECCWWNKSSTEMIWNDPFTSWNHINCLAESFSSESRIGNWPPSLASASLFCGLALGSQLCATKKRKTPIHWNLELTEPHLSQCIFGRTPNLWSCRSSGWNDKCLGCCHMTMKVTSDSAPFTAEVVRLDHFPADRCATFCGKYRWRKVAICINHRPQEQHHQQNNHNNIIIIIIINKFIKWHTALTKPGTRRLELRPWTS